MSGIAPDVPGKEFAMTLNEFRKDYEPIRFGTTRLLASLLTLLGLLINSMALVFYQPLWPGEETRRFTGWGAAVMTAGSIAVTLVGVACAVVIAWAWLGFQNPKKYLVIWRDRNWSDYNIACWLNEAGELQLTPYCKNWENFAVFRPETCHYTLNLSLRKNRASIYRWPPGSWAKPSADLSAHIVWARPESWQNETDMVWLQDKSGSRILVTLFEALAGWIPETLRKGENASLATTARKFHSDLRSSVQELNKKNEMVGAGMDEATVSRRHISMLEKLLEDAFAAIEGADVSFEKSRRLRFGKEAQAVFATLARDLQKLRGRDREISDAVKAHSALLVRTRPLPL